MNKKSLISVCLLITMLLMIACSDGTINNAETQNVNTDADTQPVVEETEISIYDDLPTNDYDGYTLRLLQYLETTSATAPVDATESNGDMINDALYERSLIVKEKLNINIELILESLANVNTMMKNAILGGDDEYDVFWQHSTTMVQNFLSQNYLLKLSDIEAFNFTKPWWDFTAMDNLQIGDNVYFGFGDINIYLFDFHSIICYNEQVHTDYNFENFYDIVNAGNWTIDKFQEYSKAAAADLDGDGELGGTNDRIGFTGFVTATMFGFLHGADVKLFDTTADHIPQYNGINEKYVNTLTKLSEMFSDTNITSTNDYKNNFLNEKAFFISCSVGELSSFRDMTTNYGVLPFPKYDENQSDYISFVTNQIQPMGMPITVSDPERTATIIENLAAESYRTVREKYFDLLLNYKYVRDSESIDMLNMIYNSSTRFEIEHIYAWVSVETVIANNLIKNSGANFVSEMTAKEEQLILAMEETIEYTK